MLRLECHSSFHTEYSISFENVFVREQKSYLSLLIPIYIFQRLKCFHVTTSFKNKNHQFLFSFVSVK